MKDNCVKQCKKFNLLAKVSIFLLFLSGCLFSILSCNKTFEVNNNVDFQDFVMEQLLFKKTGKCSLKNPEKLYFPASVNNVLLRNVFTSRGILYQYEVSNPQYSGIIQSSSFYSGYTDNGDWISKIISEVIETENGAETDDFSFARPYSVHGKPGDEIIDAESVTTLWISSNQRLNTMKFKDEIFVPVKKDGNYIFINSSSQKTIRSLYNENFTLQKRETWNITTPKDSKIIKSESFNYNENDELESTVIQTEKSKIETYYNQKKLAVRTDKYVIKEENSYLETRTLWRYTEDGKISIEECSEYTYSDDDYSSYSDKFTKRQTYTYKEDKDIPPDYKYYEDGKLKMRVIYSDKKNYVSQVFFEDNYSVASYYIDNMRKKDVYILDGQIKRVKKYD